MIQGIKNLTSENPIGQIWKYLRFFLDIPSVLETIRRIHNIPKGKFDSYVKKQARQIGYCIRQAEEYFQASSQVGLATRPTLLYYGAVSLSRAVVLLRQDGTHSFDALRKSNKHNHHGLDLIRGLAAVPRPADGLEVFFNSLQCNCHTLKKPLKPSGTPKASKENLSIETTRNAKCCEKNIPWGHFALFYRSLVPCAFQIPMEIHDHGKDTFIKRDHPQVCANLLELDSLISNPFDGLSILKTLPDMYFALKEFGIQPDLCRGSLKLKVVRYYKKDEQGNEQLEKKKEQHHFFIDGISPDQKSHLLTFYKQHNPLISVEADLGANIHLRLTREYSPSDKTSSSYYPDIVDDINGHKFYILRPETYLPEPAAHLVLLYCLGMLSRYYPDIWMNVIDENIQITELTDSLLDIVYRKFPNLILDQMTWSKHYAHL